MDMNLQPHKRNISIKKMFVRKPKTLRPQIYGYILFNLNYIATKTCKTRRFRNDTVVDREITPR